MIRVKSVYALPLLFGLCLSLPALAQSTGVGKKGIYGRNSTDPTGAAVPSAAASPAPAASAKPLTEEEKRLRAKYPLSTTARTAPNQRAHTALLQGIQYYNLTRNIFTAANKIENDFDDEEHVLKVSQDGVLTVRLQPQDILNYGPDYAYISLRIRALQQADATITKSISSFAQAQSLAPSLSVTPKWMRVARDTQKAIRYHIQFYKVSLKAIDMGYTDKELSQVARLWSNRLNGSVEPGDSLITRVNTQLFEAVRNRASKRPASEKTQKEDVIEFDALVDQLPSLDFETKND